MSFYMWLVLVTLRVPRLGLHAPLAQEGAH